MPEAKKSSVNRLASEVVKQKPRIPIAYDRYFRIPIIDAPMNERYGGLFVEYNKHPSYQALADEYGIKDFINIQPNTSPAYKPKIIKHELMHVLQSKADKENKWLDPGFEENPFSKYFWGGPDKPMQHYRQLAQALSDSRMGEGYTEAPAYLLNRDVEGLENLPQNPELAEVLRQRIFQKMRNAGYGKYTKIWE